ncbi:hypothetical protein [Paenibacillus jiagnxiensis]|uniref:hypothetical protein n=1 Tax=Paenibacillus jiagnxiensis TaxID=3228926 RepID=UPI0033B52B96
MRVSIEVEPYNSRRYGKPWVAHVKFNGPKPEYDFAGSSFLGDHDGGKLYIECNVGDVIASGQKDFRGGKKENILYIVQEDGELQEVDKVAAFEHWEARQASPLKSPLDDISMDDLIEELSRRGVNVVSRD